MAVHRATLKRKQKSFKSGHKTKGAVKAETKGRIGKTSNGHKSVVMSKQDRKNQNKQMMLLKQHNQADRVKIFDGQDGAPRNVAIIPLGPEISGQAVAETLRDSVDGEIDSSAPGVISVSRFRQRIRFFVPKYDAFTEMLDAAAAADFCLFILSADHEAGDYGEQLVRCIGAQGSTSSLGMIYNLDASKPVKAQSQIRESLVSWYSHFFTDAEKLFSLSHANESLAAVRHICQKAPRGIKWREERPYIVPEKLEVSPTKDRLVAEGFVRGRNLDVDQLVYVAGLGDLQVLAVEEVLKHGATIDADPRSWLPGQNQETLDRLSEDVVDVTEAPETGDEGIRIDGHHYVDDKVTQGVTVTPETIKKVPAGMSAYQASWLLEGEDYGLEASDDDGETNDRMMESDDDEGMLDGEEGDLVDQEATTAQHLGEAYGAESSDDEMELTMEEEDRQLKEYRRRVRDDLEFPDEVELHPGESAIERFKYHRGLRNLRSASWDPNEADPDMPAEWPRLARFSKADVARARSGTGDNMVPVGTRVVITLGLVGLQPESREQESWETKVSELIAKTAQGLPGTLFGLLRGEHKQTMVNMSINPDSEWTTPLASEAPIVAQVGPRRMLLNPLYSQAGAEHTNNLYKMLRFLHPGRSAMVSVLAPSVHGELPVVYYTNEPQPRLIGTGTVVDNDTSRVIVESDILTGAAVKIHKKLVTIRYMFFNVKDVQWFKHVPLFTKSGRSGYIKESLGTHGYYKATFDGRLTAQDIIAMALYRRRWPGSAQMSYW